MKVKPTIFAVTDIETTLKKRLAFDVAWRFIDRRGNVYYEGSYIIQDAFEFDVPFFYQKLGWYFSDAWRHLVKPLPLFAIRRIYNNHVSELLDAGHRVVFCAYNAAFDAKYLGETCQKLLGKPFMARPLPLMCIWHYWSLSCPMHYNAPVTNSGKYLSTSAQSVFAFETNKPYHEERHIAWSDVLEECEILLKVLRRKKKMPIVAHPKEFTGSIYKLANNRLGIDGKIHLV